MFKNRFSLTQTSSQNFEQLPIQHLFPLCASRALHGKSHLLYNITKHQNIYNGNTTLPHLPPIVLPGLNTSIWNKAERHLCCSDSLGHFISPIIVSQNPCLKLTKLLRLTIYILDICLSAISKLIQLLFSQPNSTNSDL